MRFVASQMTPAVFDQTTIDVAAKGKDGATYMFRATGSVPKFKGFLEVYEEGKDQKDEDDEELKHRLPLVAEGEELKFKGILPEQHFTEPPPRFNEATLVKELEADGVGRPSTYASILSTIQEREYVKKEGGKFVPTELGMVVTDLLLESFENLFDVKYTARMEEELDEIEEGKMDWREAMSEFYERFQKDLEHAERHMTDIKRMEEPTDEICEKCGKPMVIKWGRFGKFIACSGYPECSNTRELPPDPASVEGPHRAGRRGILRELRPPDGAEEGPLRAVLRLLRLSGLQDHQADRRRAEEVRCAARRKMPAVRQQSGAEEWALRRVHRVQQLSEVQIRQAEDHRGRLPELLRRRSGGAALQARQDVLRLQPLSGLRFRRLGQAAAGEVPGVRLQLPDREVAEGRPGGAVPERRVQVQEAAGAGRGPGVKPRRRSRHGFDQRIRLLLHRRGEALQINFHHAVDAVSGEKRGTEIERNRL